MNPVKSNPAETPAETPGPTPPKRTLRIEIAPSTLYRIVALVVGLALMTQMVPVILVLVVALMLVGTLNPSVRGAGKTGHQAHRPPSPSCSAPLMLVTGTVLVFTVPAIVTQVASLVKQEPELRAKLVSFLASYPLTASLASTVQELPVRGRVQILRHPGAGDVARPA